MTADTEPMIRRLDSVDAMEWARAFTSRVRAREIAPGGEFHGCDPTNEGFVVGWFANAMAAQERADRAAAVGDPAARAADAIADLADTLSGFRELIDREETRLRAEREEDERRTPAEWERALRDVEAWLAGVSFSIDVTRQDIVAGDAEKIVASLPEESSKRIVAELDRHLRTDRYLALRSALRTLAGSKPPKDLRAEAEQWATSMLGPANVGTAAHKAAVDAYLAGAGVSA